MSGTSGTYEIMALVTTTPSTTELRRISRRAAAVAPSATLAVDAKAKALQAAGEHVIGFGAGEPDFPTPAHIVEAAVAACRDAGQPPLHADGRDPGAARGHRGQDPARLGLRGGGQPGARHQRRQAGGRQRVRRAVRPGRRGPGAGPVLDDLPRGDRAGRRDAGRRVVGRDDRLPFLGRGPRAAWTPRTKALLFVSPSNPTGAVYPRDEIEAIGQWAVSKGIWVLTDEIYEHLVYGGAEHHSMPVVVPELADRCLVANGVAKTYAMTGWRVGWLIGPTDAIGAATNIQSHETSNVANVLAARRAGRRLGQPRRRRHDARRLRPPAPDHGVDAQRHSGRRVRGARGRVLRLSRRSRGCSVGASGDNVRRAARSWPKSASTRPRWRQCPERHSAHRATSACPTRWATRISSRA